MRALVRPFKEGNFQRALREAGVLFASDGMGTSVEMLEEFYSKKRMRDPKMLTEATQHRNREGIT